MGASKKRRPRPTGLNYAAIFGIGAPALRRSGTVGGATAPSVPLPSVPLRHVAAVLLLSIGLVAATMLLFHTFPVLVGLWYLGPDGAPECSADLPVVSAASPPAVLYACSCIAPVAALTQNTDVCWYMPLYPFNSTLGNPYEGPTTTRAGAAAADTGLRVRIQCPR